MTMHTTEEAEKTHVEKLNHWEKEAYKKAEDDYFKFSRITRKNLVTSYGMLLGLCEPRGRDRISEHG